MMLAQGMLICALRSIHLPMHHLTASNHATEELKQPFSSYKS
jgi:hypothetical protein